MLPIVRGLPIGWGSWLVLVIVPLFIWLLLTIKGHYVDFERDTALPPAAGSGWPRSRCATWSSCRSRA